VRRRGPRSGTPMGGVTMPDMILAATLWYQWLAWALMIGAVLTFIGLFVAYLVRVEAPRYPKRQLR
jgi:hypothetical protein